MSDYLSRVAVCDGAPDNITAEKACSTIPTNPERIASWATSVSGFSPTNPFVPLPSEVPIPFEDDAQARTHSGGDNEGSVDDGMSRVASYEGFLPMKTLPNVSGSRGNMARVARWLKHVSRFTMENPFVHLTGEGIHPDSISKKPEPNSQITAQSPHVSIPNLNAIMTPSGDGQSQPSYPSQPQHLRQYPTHPVYQLAYPPIPYTYPTHPSYPNYLSNQIRNPQWDTNIPSQTDPASIRDAFASRAKISYKGYPSPPTTLYSPSTVL